MLLLHSGIFVLTGSKGGLHVYCCLIMMNCNAVITLDMLFEHDFF